MSRSYHEAVREVPLVDLLGQLNAAEGKKAPNSLFLEGEEDLLFRTPKIAVVGTRRPSPMGALRTQRLATELARAGAVVVSGLAEGVDTLAHRAAMASHGKTIAVLGCGLDIAFPSSNAALLRDICLNHLAISQFAPGTPPRREQFPQRNRTMALISDATVIVEAGSTSGTRHQGWEALRLGRPLFLLRSLAESGLDWVEEMLQYGAQSIDSIDPLLLVLPAIAGVPDGTDAPF